MISPLVTPSQYQIAHDWAEITIMRWIERQNKLKVYDTGDLQGSFEFDVVMNPGNMLKEISFGFLFYGRFIDMGVGKGLGIESVKDNRSKWAAALGQQSRRKPKKWYSPVFMHEYNRLLELLIEHYQIDILRTATTESKPMRLVI